MRLKTELILKLWRCASTDNLQVYFWDFFLRNEVLFIGIYITQIAVTDQSPAEYANLLIFPQLKNQAEFIDNDQYYLLNTRCLCWYICSNVYIFLYFNK